MKSVYVNDTVMTYSESGDTSAPTLILISGWAQDHRLFKRVAPLLNKNFHVICPDWRGHDPEQIVNRDFTSYDLVLDLQAFIEEKKIESFHLVSTSHGCWVNIDVCERLGAEKLEKTIVIDWLMQPHPDFLNQLSIGQDLENFASSRQSFFDEWAMSTDNVDIHNHLQNEMPWFHDDMWIRACREIEKNYLKWESPLQRMQALAEKPKICHIYSQPLLSGYHELQQRFAADHSWFHPHHIPGKTHFPT